MMEFSENLDKRIYETQAKKQRAIYRLGVFKGEVPFTDYGIIAHLKEASAKHSLQTELSRALSDLDSHVVVSEDGKRVFIGDISILIGG